MLKDYTLDELIKMYKNAEAMGKDMPYTAEEFEALGEEIEHRQLYWLYNNKEDETDNRKYYLENCVSDVFKTCNVEEVINIHFGI